MTKSQFNHLVCMTFSATTGSIKGHLGCSEQIERSGEDDFPAWFNHLEERFSYKEVQLNGLVQDY